MPELLELFLTFFKIGLFTFGGGYAMLPLIQDEVFAHNWLSQAQLVDFVAVSESTPGPFAINIATYIGTETAGFLGAVCATLGVVMPSFLVILIVAHFYKKFQQSLAVQGCMTGLKPAVIGLIGAAVLSIAGTALFQSSISFSGIFSLYFLTGAVIFGLCLFLVLKKKTHPILVILLSAALGILSGYGQQLLA